MTSIATITNIRRAASGVVAGTLLYTFGGRQANLFNAHVTGTTIAFSALLPELIHLAVAARKPPSQSSSPQENRETLQNRHSYLAIAATASSAIGFYAITANKNRFKRAHYTSRHGKLGVTTMILILLQALSGLPMFNKLIKDAKTKQTVRKAHYYVGMATSALVGATLFVVINGMKKAIPNTAARGALAVAPVALSGVAFFAE